MHSFRRAAGRWGAVRGAVNRGPTMPTNKDLKRLVRARMQKTGESYTTARNHVTARQRRATAPQPAPRPAPLPADHEALAGMRDAAVEAKTGRTWPQWVALLDAAGAAAMPHRDIARALHAQHHLSTWWAQTVTVGYERLRGRRQKNQRTSGFAVTKSRTFAVPVAHLSRAFTPRNRRQWLGDEPQRPRKSVAGVVARWTCGDGTRVEAHFWSKGPGKAQVQLQHGGLATAADVERLRARWTERFVALGAWLAADRGRDRTTAG